MAVPIGADVVTSIARRYILDDVIDNIYGRNLMFFRLNSANKKIVRGGYQIEVPLMYDFFASGGAYTGFEQLDVTPTDSIKNGAWDWKQYYVPITVDGLTLIKTDSPEAIADFIRLYFSQGEMELSRLLGGGTWSRGTNTKEIDGIPLAVDDGTLTANYGGLNRTAGNDTWWQAQVDQATTTLTPAAMQTMFGRATSGGRHPTIIVTTQTNYDRYWVTGAGASGGQRWDAGPAAVDEQLYQAGFTNVVFNGVPIVVDDNIPTDGGGGAGHHMYFLNEDYIWMGVSPRADFYMEDFQTPVSQDAMVAKLFWAGNLIFNNCARQGVLQGLTS